MEHGMEVQIECDSGAEELQVLIRCRELDDQVKEIQQALSTIGRIHIMTLLSLPVTDIRVQFQ